VTWALNYRRVVLVVLVGAVASACSPRADTDTSPAPADTGGLPPLIDTASAPDTAVATPPITPSQSTTPRDTPPGGAQQPSTPSDAQGPRVSQVEYEGWRQYSVQCARCHGQDALPNPVAANLLISLGPGGPIDTPEKFVQVVSEGRPDRGMPAFKSIMTPDQIQAVYAYVKGRAEKRIPPGRPAEPAG
jgi:mono/diheme cytochrome c family protein